MTGETMPNTIEIVKLGIGEGSIGPINRIASGEVNNEQIDDFMYDVMSGDFDVAIDVKSIPKKCVDGRGLEDGPSAAGGTWTLVAADALTHQSYKKDTDKAPDHAKTVFTELVKKDHEIGGHDDDHCTDTNSGCGAEDKLDNVDDPAAPSILEFIGRRGDDIRSFLESPLIGLTIPDQLHDGIKERSRQLRAEKYATCGADIKKVTVDVAGESSLEKLKGIHNEFGVRLVMKPGVAINRTKLRQKYGEKFEIFEVNVPSIINGVEAISLSQQEADEKLIAALYYNLATAAVLSDKELRIGVYK